MSNFANPFSLVRTRSPQNDQDDHFAVEDAGVEAAIVKILKKDYKTVLKGFGDLKQLISTQKQLPSKTLLAITKRRMFDAEAAVRNALMDLYCCCLDAFTARYFNSIAGELAFYWLGSMADPSIFKQSKAFLERLLADESRRAAFTEKTVEPVKKAIFELWEHGLAELEKRMQGETKDEICFSQALARSYTVAALSFYPKDASFLGERGKLLFSIPEGLEKFSGLIRSAWYRSSFDHPVILQAALLETDSTCGLGALSYICKELEKGNALDRASLESFALCVFIPRQGLWMFSQQFLCRFKDLYELDAVDELTKNLWNSIRPTDPRLEDLYTMLLKFRLDVNLNCDALVKGILLRRILPYDSIFKMLDGEFGVIKECMREILSRDRRNFVSSLSDSPTLQSELAQVLSHLGLESVEEVRLACNADPKLDFDINRKVMKLDYQLYCLLRRSSAGWAGRSLRHFESSDMGHAFWTELVQGGEFVKDFVRDDRLWNFARSLPLDSPVLPKLQLVSWNRHLDVLQYDTEEFIHEFCSFREAEFRPELPISWRMLEEAVVRGDACNLPPRDQLHQHYLASPNFDAQVVRHFKLDGTKLVLDFMEQHLGQILASRRCPLLPLPSCKSFPAPPSVDQHCVDARLLAKYLDCLVVDESIRVISERALVILGAGKLNIRKCQKDTAAFPWWVDLLGDLCNWEFALLNGERKLHIQDALLRQSLEMILDGSISELEEQLLSGSADDSRLVALFCLCTGNPVRRMSGLNSGLFALAFSRQRASPALQCRLLSTAVEIPLVITDEFWSNAIDGSLWERLFASDMRLSRELDHAIGSLYERLPLPQLAPFCKDRWQAFSRYPFDSRVVRAYAVRNLNSVEFDMSWLPSNADALPTIRFLWILFLDRHLVKLRHLAMAEAGTKGDAPEKERPSVPFIPMSADGAARAGPFPWLLDMTLLMGEGR